MYKSKAVDSMVLVIEFFNRPHETGRLNTILILLNHSLEMLLKSIIINNGLEIRDNEGYTKSMYNCINILRSGTEEYETLAMISENQKTTLLEISSHRDEAIHGNSILGEQRLYACARSGLSIFDELLLSEFEEGINDHLPDRVLPLAGRPLRRIDLIYEQEVESIRELIEEGAREEASARVRSIENSDRIHRGEDGRAPDDEIEDKMERIEDGDDFQDIFPGVSNLTFDIQGEGPTVKLKFANEGFPARYVEDPDEADEYVIGFREVNPFDRYSLNIHDLTDNINQRGIDISWMKVWAIVRHIDVQGNESYHMVLTGPSGQDMDRYRPEAIDRVVEAVESGEVDPQQAWEESDWGE